MSAQKYTAAQILARIAGAQHGVVARSQLLRAGVSRSEIAWRLECGELIRVCRGVYRVGHAAPSFESDSMAAVLACGDGAVLRGRSAARLLGLLKRTPSMPEVLVPGRRKVAGIRVRRSRTIDDRDVMSFRNLPVTTPARTLVDLAAGLTVEELGRACHEAGVRFDIAPAHVLAVLERRPNSPGASKLHAIVSGDAPITLSKLEKRFLQLLRKHGLPLPKTNRSKGEHYVDCRWPEHKLTVELDSYRYHHSRHAWEQDRRREREARARGDDFRRYTWGDGFEDPGPMLAELHELLQPGRVAAQALA